MFQEARASQSAYQAVKHYKSFGDAPREVKDGIAWAIDPKPLFGEDETKQ